ncbi:uncharacterized protein LOC134221852 [Armigeres subalbatus]|uniref:uncharacterized protein LOC134221852 n=1 Tax=Armigeres subalbatus TaxID=124917 RepID=UPI002ED5AB7F
MVVDSGSPANIIREETYAKLKKLGAKIINERDADQMETQYESFASKDKILFTKAFEVEISVPGDDSGCWTHMLVAPHGQTDLLSKSTAFALRVLKIGYNVNNVVQKNYLEDGHVKEFPKVPDMLVRIQIDETVRSVIQPVRRLPIAMEADVEKVIQDLLEKKIIEIADGPLSWVSPLVPIRKSDVQIRLCVEGCATPTMSPR